MKKMFLGVMLLTILNIQANKVATTGNETPEEMQALVDKYGVQNQPYGTSAATNSSNRSRGVIVKKPLLNSAQRMGPRG